MNVHSQLAADRVGIKAGRNRLPDPGYLLPRGLDIRSSDEQGAWLAARVAAGEFASVEEAVRRLLDEVEADATDIDALDWAKPHVDEAVATGDFISLAEHRARTAALLAKLRDA